MITKRNFFRLFPVVLCIVLVMPGCSSAYRCGKVLSGLYGKFYSPGFPRNYYDLLQCTWSITVQKGFYVKLRFTVFDVEYYPKCSYDYLRVIEQGTVLGTFCGSTEKHNSEAISHINSTGNNIQVVFHSDYSNEKEFRGFEVHYRAVDVNECAIDNGGCDHICHNYLGGHYCSCRFNYRLKTDKRSCEYVLCKNVQLQSLRGIISSPEYPNMYPSYSNCTWKISVPRGYRIVLQFITFEVETHPDVICPYDYLSISAGGNSWRMCGKSLPKNITSKSNSMNIRFVTDGSNNMQGFLARFHTEGVKCPKLKSPLNGIINATGFSFKDEVVFSCLPGYIMNGVSRIWCRSTGLWTMDPPVCEPISCGHPGMPVRGSVRIGGLTFGESVWFECDNFYELYGESELTCNDDGLWSDDLPECVPVCGNSSFANEYRQGCRGNIVGGNDAVPGSYPWHALLKLDGRGVCGASLLNEFWLITAAHCVVNKKRQVVRPRRFTVVVGLHNRSQENETQVKQMHVGQIFEHRDYNPATFQADLALLRLTHPVVMRDFVKPICLPDTDSSDDVIKPGARGVVAGWGRTSSTKLFPNILQEVCLPVVNTSKCREVFAREGFPVTYDMFCAGPAAGGKDVCKGDSGGGYIFQDPGDERWFLGGLVSWGSNEGCALPNKYGVYLNVKDYLDWIQDRIYR